MVLVKIKPEVAPGRKICHASAYTPMQWGNYDHGMSRNPTGAVKLFFFQKTVCDIQQSLMVCDTTYDW